VKKYFFVFIIIIFLAISSGCKPGGGGSVGGSSEVIYGGLQPNFQELIIDETSIKVTKITDKSCNIYWKTNVPATSCVEYGQSVTYDKTTAENKNYVLEHNVEMYSLIPHTRFYFRVISSDVYQHLAQSKGEIFFDTYDQNFPPTAVTLNTPTDITTNSMSVTWTQSYDDDFLKYELYRDTTSAVSFMSKKVATVTSKMLTKFDDSKLNPNTTYYYVLYAFDTAELSTISNIVAGTTEIQYNTISKINFSEPSYKTTDSMTLTWNKCTDSDFASYRVYRGSKTGVDTLATLEVEYTNADSTSVEIKGLAENTTYYFRLYVLNKGKVFTASDEASFRTYKNGENWKSISGIYYGNDIKVCKNKAYISAYNFLYIINLSDYSVRSIDMPGQNDRMRKSLDESAIYIVNRTNKELIVFDTVYDSVKNRFPAGNSPTDVAVSSAGDYYYIPDLHEGQLNKYRLSDGGFVMSKYFGPFLTAAVAGRNSSDVFVAKMQAYSTNEVLVLNPDTLAVKNSIFVGTDPVYLYMDVGGLNVYCAGYQSKSVTRINSLTGIFTDSFEVGIQPHSIVQMQSGAYTFIANFGGANISMFSNSQNRVIETFADGKTPRAIELSPSNRELFVVDYEEHVVNIYALRK